MGLFDLILILDGLWLTAKQSKCRGYSLSKLPFAVFHSVDSCITYGEEKFITPIWWAKIVILFGKMSAVFVIASHFTKVYFDEPSM